MKKGSCGAAKVAWVLVLVGALNWGLVGLGGFFGGNWNVVELLLGSWSWLENLVYLLVGLSGMVMLFGCKCKSCKCGGDESKSCCKTEENDPEAEEKGETKE